ncbi:CoA transferase [Sporosarcina sp. ACRSL]|uniref:CaiB/BaiF CoA transferase family protein n=1 Tax=Sporosarcina sp. ACRSL TaxID=2918215 RepID=UPI001EF42828|nr:CoA transferase [Sporosarcina sp. ACRSL]MCG7343738.1 CoA transferase [Sporosarcina sp. ACRSL]
MLPLQGLKILDISTMLAAPWASTFLADYGAEVIKVEHPQNGDHARKYGAQKDGEGIFWKTLNRNKKGITLNLKAPEGKRIFLQLVKDADVVVENFRPGTLDKWGLDWATLLEANPKLILLRTSGFGQDGPYAKRGGFGTVAEAMSGFTSINGEKGGKPTLPGMALADGVSSIFGALSIMIALYAQIQNGIEEGQQIDINLYEPLMRLLEPQITAYDQLGIIPEPIGNSSLQTAPRNAYLTKDNTWVALSGSTQSITENIFHAIGRVDLITNPKFSTNEQRLKNVVELDEIIGNWIKQFSYAEVVEIFSKAGAVVGPMYNIAQLFEDEHYQYRESFISVKDNDFGEMRVPNVVAKFSKTPGAIRHLGPDKGQHTEEILKEKVQLTDEQIQELKKMGII